MFFKFWYLCKPLYDYPCIKLIHHYQRPSLGSEALESILHQKLFNACAQSWSSVHCKWWNPDTWFNAWVVDMFFTVLIDYLCCDLKQSNVRLRPLDPARRTCVGLQHLRMTLVQLGFFGSQLIALKDLLSEAFDDYRLFCAQNKLPAGSQGRFTPNLDSKLEALQ